MENCLNFLKNNTHSSMRNSDGRKWAEGERSKIKKILGKGIGEDVH